LTQVNSSSGAPGFLSDLKLTVSNVYSIPNGFPHFRAKKFKSLSLGKYKHVGIGHAKYNFSTGDWLLQIRGGSSGLGAPGRRNRQAAAGFNGSRAMIGA